MSVRFGQTAYSYGSAWGEAVMLTTIALAAGVSVLTTTMAAVTFSSARARLIAAVSCTILVCASVDLADGDHRVWMVPVIATLFTVLRRRSAWFAWARWNMTLCVLTPSILLTQIALQGVIGAHNPILGLAGLITLLLLILAFYLTVSFAFEIHDVLGRRFFPALTRTIATPQPKSWPGVCIQVPAYNEPPELLAQTIRQLAKQEHPGEWMVQGIDNNTVDPTVWEPIKTLCAQLGTRFQFMHLGNWPGYKSGALNEGLRCLPEWVEVIAVVDADYLVEPDFLRRTAGHFADPAVGFVQTPQDYRNWNDHSYTRGLFHSYRHFFDISMVSRNERNAIIFGGTMGLIRRTALAQLGGWDQWCITEDAETSLRLLALGYCGVYDPRSYGQGIMPFTFTDLQKQRFRWAFGGVQILKRHLPLLLGLTPSQLTWRQRATYLTGGVQWFADSLNLVLGVTLLATVPLVAFVGMTASEHVVESILMTQLLIVSASLMRVLWGLQIEGNCSFADAVRAVLIWFGLSFTVTKACRDGLRLPSGIFMRTSKRAGNSAWREAIASSKTESKLAIAYLGCALLFVAMPQLIPGAGLYSIFLVMQAVVFASAPLCAVWAEGALSSPKLAMDAFTIQKFGQRQDNRVRVTVRI